MKRERLVDLGQILMIMMSLSFLASMGDYFIIRLIALVVFMLGIEMRYGKTS